MKLTLRLIAAAALLLATGAGLSAQKKEIPKMGKFGYPIYNDYSIPKPDKELKITRDDLQLTDRYLGYYPNGIAEASPEDMKALYRYFKDDPTGQQEWTVLQDRALKCIPTWDMGQLIQKRYVYSLAYLKPLALLYIYTGNELVSDFIRGHLAKAASLPVDFWIHAELRKMDPKKPQGCIETSYINQAFGTAIEAVRRNMSPEEIRNVETAWKEKGFGSAMNWLEAHPDKCVGNFTAVIAIGAMYAAKYFHDEAAWNEGLRQLKMYVDDCIFPDGSDFEGYNYYGYPAGQILAAAVIMTPEQIKAAFDGSGISKVMHWRVAGMLFGHGPCGYPSPMRITWGDNPSSAAMTGTVDLPTWLSVFVARDGVASWIQQKYDQKPNYKTMLLQSKFIGQEVPATSPAEAGIPLLTAFQSGDCYMRSGWGDDDVVLGLKARNGDPVAQMYGHARPEINSLALGAFGEYLICTAASASYRSPIRTEHDQRTWRANVVTVDGKDQLFPFGYFKPLGSFGHPDAEIVRKEILPDGSMILANEAAKAYATPMKTALRTARYIPEGKFFIVTDTLVPEDGQVHHFDHRFFIFNHDRKTSIDGDASLIKVERPNAELYIAVKGSSKFQLSYRDAYIHGLGGRDYDPGGKQEGKKGSAVGLQWSCDAKTLSVTSVLYPCKPGSPAPKIKFSKGAVTVNGVKYAL